MALAAGGLGGGAVLSACTGSPTPVAPGSTPPALPDPLLAVLDERTRLVAQYDAAALEHPDLLPLLSPLRVQTEQQVVALRLALAWPEPTTSAAPSSDPAGTSSAVPIDPAATIADLRSAVQVSGTTAAALCVTTTTERAPLVGSLAAAASCHELLLR